MIGWLAFFQLAKFGKAFYLCDFAGFFPPQQYRTDRLLGGGLFALHAEGDEVGLIKLRWQEVEQSTKQPVGAEVGEVNLLDFCR